MQLLVEQKEYLEGKVEELLKRERQVKEQKKFGDHTEKRDDQYQYTEIKRDLDNINAQRLSYEELLASAKVVVHFNNQQIDIGTTFEVQFSDADEVEQYTLTEVSLPGFGSLEGYVSLDGEFGRALLGKAVGDSFSYVIGDDKKKQQLSGKVVQIIPKKDMAPKVILEEPVKVEQPVLTVEKKARRKESVLFKRYYAEILQDKDQEEIKRINGITVHQKQYLKQYLEELILKEEKLTSNRNALNAYASKLAHIRNELQREIIVPKFFDQVELGLPVILEIETKDGIKVQEKELIAREYQKEQEYGFLPVRSTLGFLTYQAKMGEYIKQSGHPYHQFRVAQFGILKDHLLLPFSANLSMDQEDSMRSSTFYKLLQEGKRPKITFSQRELLAMELLKMDASPYESNYTRYLKQLREKILEKSIVLQTAKMKKTLSEKVGLGSQVSYVLQEGEDKSIKVTELIECAFTTEEKGAYTEKSSLLGQALLGKQKDDFFTVPYEGKMMTGKIVTVSNHFEKKISEQKMQAILHGTQQKTPTKKILIPPKEKVVVPYLPKREIISIRYKDYRRQLLEENSPAIQKELSRLDAITKNQKAYLESYKKLLEEKKNMASDTSLFYRTLSHLVIVKHALEKETLNPETYEQIDLGHRVILEVDEKIGKKYVKEGELIAQSYGMEKEQGFLSLRGPIGSLIYKAKLGETFKLHRTPMQKEQTIRVAQFEIDRGQLYIPASANLLKLSDQEKKTSFFYQTYQDRYWPVMTASQKELLDRELLKASATSSDSDYINRLHLLQKALVTGDLYVQSKEDLEQNQDRIGLGSQIYYLSPEQGVQKTELIVCPYTTEEKNRYTEMFSPLGKQLRGKKENDIFSVSSNGKTLTGIILSVKNTPLEKEMGEGISYSKTR